jgi:hypothetical protein
LNLWNRFRLPKVPDVRVGQLVEVRSAAEILATLDENGEFENLPFMPEMLQFCGKRLTVHKVAHKSCDMVTEWRGMRWMTNAVHLTGARCDGTAHGGCQNGCSLYWKEAWFKPVTTHEPDRAEAIKGAPPAGLDLLDRATRKAPSPDGEVRYACQATELPRATERMGFLDLRQYILDLRSGNVRLLPMLRTFFIGLFNRFQSRSRRVLPEYMWINGGRHWDWLEGTVVGRTPTAILDLQPGELVRIKSKEEISKTIDANRLNRGMGIEEEMAWHCGRTARVARRVDRCLDEKTGRMLSMKNPCIVLDDVVCQGVYNRNCPRGYLPFWREIWLERVDEQNASR